MPPRGNSAPNGPYPYYGRWRVICSIRMSVRVLILSALLYVLSYSNLLYRKVDIMSIKKAVVYTTYADFKAEDRRVRKSVKMASDKFVNHAIKALDFFHTKGAYNIQIVNDIVDTAKAVRFQGASVAKWLKPVCGHVLEKGVFGAKAEGTVYADIDPGEFFTKYPDWYAYAKGQPKAEFVAEESRDKLVKALETQAKKFEADYRLAALDLEKHVPENAEAVAA